MPQLLRNPSSQGCGAPSPSPFTMPGSPARSLSTASVSVTGSMAAPEQSADTPEMSSVPSLMAASGGNMHGGMPMYTPPQTPGYVAATPVVPAAVPATGAAGTTAAKRENEGGEEGPKDKRRRIAPTLVSEQ